MRQMSLILTLFLAGCTGIGGNDSGNTTNGSNICNAGICVDGIKKSSDGSLFSPIDFVAVGVDSTQNRISTKTLLVKFRPDADISKLVGNIDGRISLYLPEFDIYEIRFDFDSIELLEQKLGKLAGNNDVEFVSKNFTFELDSLDNENFASNGMGSFVPGLWGFQTIKLAGVYRDLIDINELAPVKVAILDGVFDTDHPELQGQFVDTRNLVINSDYVSCNLADCQESKETFRTHGTIIAGIIAAKDGNDGMNGIVPHARLAAYQIMPGGDINFNYLRAIARALDRAIDSNISVVNMSIGGSLKFYADLIPENDEEAKKAGIALFRSIIKTANSHGIVLVASVGNDNEDAADHYPSAFDEVISVGAIDRNAERSIWSEDGSASNYSSESDENVLTLVAPGTGIVSTIPYSVDDLGYRLVSATSFSTPMVTGLAALLKSVEPDLTPDEVRRIMIDSADKVEIDLPLGFEQTWNRINVYEAVKMLLEKNSRKKSLGERCDEDFECKDGSLCRHGQCLNYCFSHDVNLQNIDCNNVKCYGACNDGFSCVKWKNLFSNDLPYEMTCFKSCHNDSDCDDRSTCLRKLNGDEGFCIDAEPKAKRKELCGEFFEGYNYLECQEGLVCDMADRILDVDRGFVNIGHCAKLCDPNIRMCDEEDMMCWPENFVDVYGNEYCGQCEDMYGQSGIDQPCQAFNHCPMNSVCIASNDEDISRCRELCDPYNPSCPHDYYCYILSAHKDNCAGIDLGVCAP